MTKTVCLAMGLVAFGFLGCSKKTATPTDSSAAESASVKGTVRASGSSALMPLVNAAKERFEAENEGISVEVSAGGSKKGIADVASGAVHIGNSDIPAPKDLEGELVDHKVAVVPFAIVANKGSFNANVTKLTMEQLAGVLRGQVKNWSELGGESQPIVLINRAPSSGTRAVVGQVVLGGDDFAEGRTEDNSGALVAKLKQTQGALSYVGISYVSDDLLTLAIETKEGVVGKPTFEDIQAGCYPLWSYEHMFTKGEPTGATKLFLDYVMSPAFQREVLPNVKGFFPAINLPQAARAE